MFSFVNPNMLFLLFLIPLVVGWDWFSFKKLTPRIQFSNLALIKDIQKRDSLLKYIPIVLKSLLILFIVLALARPRHTLEKREYTTEGVDIAMVIDVSASMLEKDFRPTRIDAAKRVALDFIKKRENDRIAIVTFGRDGYSLVPLTNDLSVLSLVVENITIDTRRDDRTAIGNGIGYGINRLRNSPSKSRVMILLTDGMNNWGALDPVTATNYAKMFGIRIYPVGVGRPGRDFDIDALHRIAQITGTGRATHAANEEQLQRIFDEIDRLEKTEINTNIYYEHREMFIYYLYLAAGILFMMILSRSIFRMSLP